MGEPRKGWLRSIDGDESWTASSEQRANVAAHVVDPVPVVVLPVDAYERMVAERDRLLDALSDIRHCAKSYAEAFAFAVAAIEEADR